MEVLAGTNARNTPSHVNDVNTCLEVRNARPINDRNYLLSIKIEVDRDDEWLPANRAV